MDGTSEQHGLGDPGGAAGTVALVGSGEYLQAMVEVDRGLLSGRPRRAVFLPTAAAEEGAATVDYWLRLGSAHFTRLGVEPVPLRVLTREDAEREDLADRVAGAGLIYLSGGNPGYLADTLRDSAVWAAIVSAWREGASLAGCSAGACALTRIAEDVRAPGRSSGNGLGLIRNLAVIPHYDRMHQWVPDIEQRLLERAPEGVTVLGIDEETALVGSGVDSGGGAGGRYVVAGRQAVWVLAPGADPTRYEAGAVLDLAPVG